MNKLKYSLQAVHTIGQDFQTLAAEQLTAWSLGCKHLEFTEEDATEKLHNVFSLYPESPTVAAQ